MAVNEPLDDATGDRQESVTEDASEELLEELEDAEEVTDSEEISGPDQE